MWESKAWLLVLTLQGFTQPTVVVPQIANELECKELGTAIVSKYSWNKPKFDCFQYIVVK